MRKGKAVTVYLHEDACAALDAAVSERAEQDLAEGLTGYAVTNRSKLISEIVTDYLIEWQGERLTFTKIREVVTPIFKRYGVKRAELFGSYSRGDQRPDSDVDLLVDEGDAVGLKFFRLQRELSEALGRSVDLQSMNGNAEFLEKIANEQKVIYVA